VEGEDFCGEGLEVGGEEGEGDVFGGLLVVVAELEEIPY
jgi:ribonuclease HIII